MKTILIACKLLKALRQAVCRPFSDQLRRLSSLRSGSLRSALLTALLGMIFASTAARAAEEVIRASSMGFNPADSTAALQAAINSGARKVIVENMGAPWIVDKIQLASDQEMVFEKGVVVQAKHVLIKDGVCDNNYRQGISVISARNLLIENCTLKNTGGTPPQAGIDFEPNHPTEELVNCVMRNCFSENNDGSGYKFSLPYMRAESAPISIRIENCRAIGCRNSVHFITNADGENSAVTGTMEFVNCRFEGGEDGILIDDKPVHGAQVRFVNCQIVNAATGTVSQNVPIPTSLNGCLPAWPGVEGRFLSLPPEWHSGANPEPWAHRHRDEKPHTLGWQPGRLTCDRFSAAGAELQREIWQGDDGRSLAVRLTVTNREPEARELVSLVPVDFPREDGLLLQRRPLAKWEVLAQKRQKNSIPEAYLPRAGSSGAELSEEGHALESGPAKLKIEADPFCLLRPSGDAGQPHLLFGLLSQTGALSQIELSKSPDGDHYQHLRARCLLDRVIVPPGGSRSSEWVILMTGSTSQELIADYAERVAAYHQVPVPSPRPPSVWCSWYHYGTSFTEADLHTELRAMQQRRVPFDVLLIDDFRPRAWGDWFDSPLWPSGLADAAQRIRAAGYRPGFWTAPYVIEKASLVAREHPEWLLRRFDGKPVVFRGVVRIPQPQEDPANPQGPPVFRVEADENYVLDPTAPGAAQSGAPVGGIPGKVRRTRGRRPLPTRAGGKDRQSKTMTQIGDRIMKPTFSLLAALLLAPLAGLQATEPAPSRFQHFITRQGDKLYDGEKEFRFIGANMPGLGLPYDYTMKLPERMVLPTPWEQEDGLKTLDQMNLRVVRNWSLPIREPNDKRPDGGMTWHYVQGPGQFNEESFKVLDSLLALANRHGIRVVFSLSCCWRYLGGVETYLAHRNKQGKALFFTDPQVKEDFKQTIRHVLTRRNTVSDVPYKDDKAILCWELGNELWSVPYEVFAPWQSEMAAFIKSLDPNHLIMDARANVIPQEPDPNVDIFNIHYYGNDFAASCRSHQAQSRGKRPFVIGEFGPYDGKGFTPENVVEKTREFMNAVQESGTAGALLWSMYFHHRDGGFYWHQIFTYPSVWSYHWPGFPSAEAQREIGIMRVMREAAFQIQGLPVPPVLVPDSPELLPIGDVPLLSWRGSAGASGYDIERAPKAAGPWTALATNVSDADIAYRPLFSDTTVRTGETWFYRVTARNASGASKPSNIVGPVAVKRLCLADELQDFSRVHAKSAGLTLNNDYNALYAEYLFRAKGNTNDWLSYQVAAPIESVKVVAFFAKDLADLTLQVSADGATFSNLQPARKEQRLGSPMSGPARGQHRTMVEYECAVPAGNRYLKVKWNGEAELDRIEIFHAQ